MSKSVEALQMLIEEEKNLKVKYESAVQVMGHDTSKSRLKEIIAGKQSIIEMLENTLMNSSHCPQINPNAKKGQCSC
ncbi:MAG TPA: hypothetical protein VI387_09855 [Candidatus Brocadiales bacterium]|nr:hypothetical protein [Candidatus Brocadiales bacterium]